MIYKITTKHRKLASTSSCSGSCPSGWFRKSEPTLGIVRSIQCFQRGKEMGDRRVDAGCLIAPLQWMDGPEKK